MVSRRRLEGPRSKVRFVRLYAGLQVSITSSVDALTRSRGKSSRCVLRPRPYIRGLAANYDVSRRVSPLADGLCSYRRLSRSPSDVGSVRGT